jgi:hypothetical protein
MDARDDCPPRCWGDDRYQKPSPCWDSFFTWPRGAMIYPAVLVPIGAVLFAVAMWRSRAVPGWVAGLFAFSTVLVAVPVPLHAVRLAGAILGLVAGAAVAIAVRREPATVVP